MKPDTAVEWSPALLEAGEIAAVVPLPQTWLDDVTFDATGSVRDKLAGSFAKVFKRAALYGAANMPATWPAGGLTAAANANTVTGADPLAALDAALGRLEQDGVTPNGILGEAALRAALRGAMVGSAAGRFVAAPPALWGVGVRLSSFWDDSVGIALASGWSDVIVAIRRDLTYSTLRGRRHHQRLSGQVLYNALQQDGLIVRASIRIALQLVQPLSPVTSVPSSRSRWRRSARPRHGRRSRRLGGRERDHRPVARRPPGRPRRDRTARGRAGGTNRQGRRRRRLHVGRHGARLGRRCSTRKRGRFGSCRSAAYPSTVRPSQSGLSGRSRSL